MEAMYCSQQIVIPPNLPWILKTFAKAAIRTQPYDLLTWSAAYFRAMAEDTVPPVKERIEYPLPITPSGLSPGFLKVLINQLGRGGLVPLRDVYERWCGVCLRPDSFVDIVKLSDFNTEESKIDWLKFVAIAAGHISPTLKATMILLCEVLTEEPEGGSAMLQLDTFIYLFTFLARRDCGLENPFPDMLAVDTMPRKESQLSTHMRSWDQIIEEVKRTGSEEWGGSKAGLMVWQDIHPTKSSVHRMKTPGPSQEGLTSEYGMMVWDKREEEEKCVDYMTVRETISSPSVAMGQPVCSVVSSATQDKVAVTESVLPFPSRTHRSSIPSSAKLEDMTDKDWLVVVKEARTVEKEGDVECPPTPVQSLTTVTGVSNVNASTEMQTTVLAETDVVVKQSDVVVKTSDLAAKKSEGVAQKDSQLKETVSAVQGEPNIMPAVASTKEDAVPQEQAADGDKMGVVQGVEGSQAGTDRIPLTKGVTLKVEPAEDDAELMPGGKLSNEESDVAVNIDEGVFLIQHRPEDRQWSQISSQQIGCNDPGRMITAEDAVSILSTGQALLPKRSVQNLLAESGVASQFSKYEPRGTDEISLGQPSLFEQQAALDLKEKKVPKIYYFWLPLAGIGPVISDDQINEVLEYVTHWASKQQGMVMPRNLRHFLCPPFDKVQRFDHQLQQERSTICQC